MDLTGLAVNITQTLSMSQTNRGRQRLLSPRVGGVLA